jgi:hypothetical protein
MVKITVVKISEERQWLDTLWNALWTHREVSIPEGSVMNDSEWDDICFAMARIKEELGLEDQDYG